MLRYSISLAAFAVVLMALTVSAPAFAQSTVYPADVVVDNQVTTNQCSTAEPVMLNGNMHFEYMFNTDSDGVNHFSVTVANNLTGVGQTSGTSYAASDSNPYSVDSSQSSADLTVEFRSDLNPEGSGPSLTLVQSLHITVDTSGIIGGRITQNNTQCGSGS
jgi:phosphate-selective porin